MPQFRRAFSLFAALSVVAAVAGCAKEDLKEKPAPLGDFSMGFAVAVADKVQKVPILSRDATPDEWEAAFKKAMDDRFSRFDGPKLYDFGISVEAYALAPPGIPVIASPKSVLAIKVTIWDDAISRPINDKPEEFTIIETSGKSFVGSGLLQNKDEQMAFMAARAAARIEDWLRKHPEWFTPEAAEARKKAAEAEPAPAAASPADTSPAKPKA